jgi:lysophospholipase L1-like esterase
MSSRPTGPSQSVVARVFRARGAAAHLRRFGLASLVVLVAVAVFAFLPGRLSATGSFVGPKYYYLGLGDSLAFGYQPNLDWSHGYVYQFYSNLQAHGSKSRTDYGCNGEKSTTFIKGGCPYAYALHNYYFGSQLNAALSFLKNHAGNVSPVTLDMGANDVLPDINSSTCQVSSSWESDLATMNTNLTGTILPKLISALKNSSGQLTGDLVMMNYYNPFANKCPADASYTTELNNDLATDWNAAWAAQGFSPPPHGLVDVYTAFANNPPPPTGDGVQNVCTNTWMCSSSADIHATTAGYGVIAGAFESLTGY